MYAYMRDVLTEWNIRCITWISQWCLFAVTFRYTRIFFSLSSSYASFLLGDRTNTSLKRAIHSRWVVSKDVCCFVQEKRSNRCCCFFFFLHPQDRLRSKRDVQSFENKKDSVMLMKSDDEEKAIVTSLLLFLFSVVLTSFFFFLPFWINSWKNFECTVLGEIIMQIAACGEVVAYVEWCWWNKLLMCEGGADK